jgi:hypothetical protein
MLLEIMNWFALDDTEWPFSFVNICEALDIDSGELRSMLMQWHESARGRDGWTLLAVEPCGFGWDDLDREGMRRASAGHRLHVVGCTPVAAC